MALEIPLILQLDKTGNPVKWITCEKAVYYYNKGLILWENGTSTITLRGGTNSRTNTQSQLHLNTIIAVSGNVNSFKKRQPSLTNKILFKRDGNICAYCDVRYRESLLTRDHVHPVKWGGKNVWTNVVTACKPCNSHKGHKLLPKLGWKLGYEPYQPSNAEYLFLKNLTMTPDQYEFLLNLIDNPTSRIREFYSREITT